MADGLLAATRVRSPSGADEPTPDASAMGGDGDHGRGDEGDAGETDAEPRRVGDRRWLGRFRQT